MNLRTVLLASLLFCAGSLAAQPFASDIAAFKKADSLHFPPKQAILFVGSSSFTRWTDVQDYFPGFTIINRGFGGSTLPDVTRYADDIIFPYFPRQVVIYCGENDIAYADTVTATTVYSRFLVLFQMIRDKLPAASIVFISLKPSPSRWHMRDRIIRTNELIQAFMRGQPNAVFVDVYHKMLGPGGLPLSRVFTSDSLHMNAEGYAIWEKAIEPVLMR